MAVVLLGLAFIAGALSGSASAAEPARCQEPAAQVDTALRLVRSLDLKGARTHLSMAEEALGCSAPATPEVLARMWMVEGFHAVLSGNPSAASDPFAAAARLAPSVWVDDFGDEMRAAWDAAQALENKGEASLLLAPSLSNAWRVYVDGAQTTSSPVVVAPGLHAVQVAAKDAPASFARVVLLSVGESTSLEHGLPERPPKPKPATTAAMHLGIGADIAAGADQSTLLNGETLTEPGLKIVVPFEVGVRVGHGNGWGRVALDGGPLTNGRYLYAGESEPEFTSWAVGGSLSGGYNLKGTDLGALVGLSDPSRMRLRALSRIPIASGTGVELRAGVNLATGGRVEPAGTVLFTYQPQLYSSQN